MRSHWLWSEVIPGHLHWLIPYSFHVMKECLSMVISGRSAETAPRSQRLSVDGTWASEWRWCSGMRHHPTGEEPPNAWTGAHCLWGKGQTSFWAAVRICFSIHLHSLKFCLINKGVRFVKLKPSSCLFCINWSIIQPIIMTIPLFLFRILPAELFSKLWGPVSTTSIPRVTLGPGEVWLQSS